MVPAAEAGKGKYNPKLLEAIDWAMEVDEHDRPQSVEVWRQALVGGSRSKSSAKSVRKPATQPTRGTTTERTGPSWSAVALTLALVALLGAGAWWGWQQDSEWFKLGSDDTLPVTQQETPAEMPKETLQETEPGKTGEELASGKQTPLPEDTSQTAPAITATESAKMVAEQPERTPAKAPPQIEDEVTRLLAAAKADLKAKRLTSPAGNNAWDRYQRVLEIDPTNLEAVEGVNRVIESYMELFGIAIEQEDFEQAESYLSRIRDLHPDSTALLAGKQRLEDARQTRAARLVEIERQAEEAERKAELERQRLAKVIDEHWTMFEAAIQAEDLYKAADILVQVRDLHSEEPQMADKEQQLAELQRQHAIKEHLAAFEAAMEKKTLMKQATSLTLHAVWIQMHQDWRKEHNGWKQHRNDIKQLQR